MKKQEIPKEASSTKILTFGKLQKILLSKDLVVGLIVGLIVGITTVYLGDYLSRRKDRPDIAIYWAYDKGESRSFIIGENVSQFHIEYLRISIEYWSLKEGNLESPPMTLPPRGTNGSIAAWEVTGYIPIWADSQSRLKNGIKPELDIWLTYRKKAEQTEKSGTKMRANPRENVVMVESKNLNIINRVTKKVARIDLIHNLSIEYIGPTLDIPVSSFP